MLSIVTGVLYMSTWYYSVPYIVAYLSLISMIALLRLKMLLQKRTHQKFIHALTLPMQINKYVAKLCMSNLHVH